MRLDKLLQHQNLASSRQRAQALIAEGQVWIDNQCVTKASKTFPETTQIEIRGETLQWVSRGGLKLEQAFNTWPLANPITCLDVGASTGGFTDVLLSLGANKVYAVDVGHEQLVEKLRQDDRVVNLEGMNIRQLDNNLIPEPIDFCCIDVSFISLTLVLPEIIHFLQSQANVVALVKPQFEVGQQGLGKKGVVKDEAQHQFALDKVRQCAENLGFEIKAQIDSPVLGGKGNKEFLLWLVWD
ncbi:TlyA family RNA methyltransferase [Candidatus Albibeggiatoa sp. nov. NOAA]|uniref:TlyA family RNA methyltransferase n=1 Tax=Candidatus Albibeggiatoa sp. nov. NOAA TaxID=3162724 RepID=UPI0032F9EED3|nr:TlyA family RNA methyltransferase [Thiotrichaceae bacterium]